MKDTFEKLGKQVTVELVGTKTMMTVDGLTVQVHAEKHKKAGWGFRINNSEMVMKFGQGRETAFMTFPDAEYYEDKVTDADIKKIIANQTATKKFVQQRNDREEMERVGY